MVHNFHKLVTKEDPFFIHKAFGIISFCNFMYRYYLLFAYGQMMINSQVDMGILVIHGLLSTSSLIFNIPKKRHASLPMIFPEFRLHSIVFGLRSIVCCFIDYYGNEYKLYYKMSVCIGTMFFADTITKHYAIAGNSTMRNMPFAELIPINYRLSEDGHKFEKMQKE